MLRLLIATPFLLVLVLFALSNRQDVTLGLWPTDLALTAPLSVVILGAMAIAFLVGAVLVWVPSLAVRCRARRFQREALALQARLAARESAPAAAQHAPATAAVAVR